MMVGLETMSDYKEVGLQQFHCLGKPKFAIMSFFAHKYFLVQRV